MKLVCIASVLACILLTAQLADAADQDEGHQLSIFQQKKAMLHHSRINLGKRADDAEDRQQQRMAAGEMNNEAEGGNDDASDEELSQKLEMMKRAYKVWRHSHPRMPVLGYKEMEKRIVNPREFK